MMAPEGLLAEVLRIDSSIPHSRHFSFQRLRVCMGGGGGGGGGGWREEVCMHVNM